MAALVLMRNRSPNQAPPQHRKPVHIMRNRSLLPPLDVIPLLFRMFRIPDKLLRWVHDCKGVLGSLLTQCLRSMAFTAIVSDIKKVNAKHKNNSLNPKP